MTPILTVRPLEDAAVLASALLGALADSCGSHSQRVDSSLDLSAGDSLRTQSAGASSWRLSLDPRDAQETQHAEWRAFKQELQRLERASSVPTLPPL